MIDAIEFIPSRDMQQALREEGHQFTDMETATLIHNLDLLPKRRQELLEQVAAATSDEQLRAQIAFRLEKEQQERDWFREASEGYVFGVQVYDEGDSDDDSIEAYFAGFDAAFEFGHAQGTPFKISKWKALQEAPCNDGWGSASDRGFISFDADGEMETSLLWETGKDGTVSEGGFAPWLVGNEDGSWPNFLFFEDRWLDLPNLYELGDVVRVIGEHANYIDPAYDWAIVEADHEPWEQFRQRVNVWLANVEAGRESADRVLADFSDMQVTVELPCKDGTFIHDHISPLFLERVDEEPPDGSVEAELQQAAQGMVRGECSIDWFTHVLKRRINVAARARSIDGE